MAGPAASPRHGWPLHPSLGAGTHSIDYSFATKANRSVTLAAGETKVINVQLGTDAVAMDDVVVVGYGVQRKRK